MRVNEKILTEVGTNEWQVVVFYLGQQAFAINVDKTREILRWTGCRPVPDANPAMIGITTVRGEVLPLVDLGRYLKIDTDVELENSKIIIAEFNEIKLGFVVEGVERIYRINSDELDASLTGTFLGENSLYVIKRDDRNIILLDYERIVQAVNPSLMSQYRLDEVKAAKLTLGLGDLDRYRILVAEDSPLIRRQVIDVLADGGFHNVESVGHGKAAWDRISEEDPGHFDLLISDIEMPKMDGFALTRLVKQDEERRDLPVVIFSSIMADDIRRKAASIGAEAQITKPEIGGLVEKVCELLLERSSGKSSG
ncbi:response regulator receiver modulated CheW protein [Dethiosulfovibrio peptidovorans DSM 11002]|uniref:Response regulator receiver modulated CheW protein n=1 Tax=Dethiosulfovibrio peptidovorans DSM 11002 TaxID=469381 RepID=D2Z816_9BACT|nr:chemotaxis protein [Dethiosulfovibrio peptidovorans]EFC91613.1 response regulator receiver modulated CheW protein [Dethiosulfovibrio peptidovorans DSM 11002]